MRSGVKVKLQTVSQRSMRIVRKVKQYLMMKSSLVILAIPQSGLPEHPSRYSPGVSGLIMNGEQKWRTIWN